MCSWRSSSLPLHAFAAVLSAIRRMLFWLFLPLAALFAFPALMIALLMWWRASKTWDARERWSGTWLLALVCGAIYGVLLYVMHPLPSLLERVVFELLYLQGLSQHIGALVQLWGLNLLLTPVYALILEASHPLSRYARTLAPRRPAGSLQANTMQAGTAPFCTAPAPLSSTSSSAAMVPSSPLSLLPRAEIPPVEPLGIFLGGDLYAWVFGNQVCIPLEELMRR